MTSPLSSKPLHSTGMGLEEIPRMWAKWNCTEQMMRCACVHLCMHVHSKMVEMKEHLFLTNMALSAAGIHIPEHCRGPVCGSHLELHCLYKLLVS